MWLFGWYTLPAVSDDVDLLLMGTTDLALVSPHRITSCYYRWPLFPLSLRRVINVHNKRHSYIYIYIVYRAFSLQRGDRWAKRRVAVVVDLQHHQIGFSQLPIVSCFFLFLFDINTYAAWLPTMALSRLTIVKFFSFYTDVIDFSIESSSRPQKCYF